MVRLERGLWMMVEKTIVCRILDPTERKEGLLVKEYSNAQGYIRGETEDLYSATKQAMDKYVEKVQNDEYPLFLRNDTFKLIFNTLFMSF
ncbi:hypothetical protein AKJ54_01045 [candidate division MSBL1 archaeon SCGC-AAA382K21]|uniref:Uncharacterized protein n=1 Tax=candidate division MSBL1 archaeon SCGC-AAA382K21 TaxID=1698283 RepID=A0A133VK65_9EURY|nr:hypothetical protein AKJ54_01045 [candidate division MSBL1 archaeon SCGC-AAA382K21]